MWLLPALWSASRAPARSRRSGRRWWPRWWPRSVGRAGGWLSAVRPARIGSSVVPALPRLPRSFSARPSSPVLRPPGWRGGRPRSCGRWRGRVAGVGSSGSWSGPARAGWLLLRRRRPASAAGVPVPGRRWRWRRGSGCRSSCSGAGWALLRFRPPGAAGFRPLRRGAGRPAGGWFRSRGGCLGSGGSRAPLSSPVLLVPSCLLVPKRWPLRPAGREARPDRMRGCRGHPHGQSSPACRSSESSLRCGKALAR